MKINRAQRLYVLPCGNGFTCIGFDVAERQRRAVLEWIGKPVQPMRVGTKRHYEAYHNAMMEGFAHADKTGQRCNSDLTPALVGLEGRRVEVIEPDGNRTRFYVGKSTGWMPVHLEIKRRDSTGGSAVYIPQGAAVRVVA